jgi:hypothetical protein
MPEIREEGEGEGERERVRESSPEPMDSEGFPVIVGSTHILRARPLERTLSKAAGALHKNHNIV